MKLFFCILIVTNYLPFASSPAMSQFENMTSLNHWSIDGNNLHPTHLFPKAIISSFSQSAIRLWAFHFDGNWFSLNGKDWTKSKLANSIQNLAFLDYIQFNDAIWGLGHFEGNIEKFKLTTSIYKTTEHEAMVGNSGKK